MVRQTVRILDVPALLLLLGVALLFSSSPAAGQGTDMKIGASGGWTAMTYGGENASDSWDRRTGKAVGAMVLLNTPDEFLHAQAEARYVQKGARAEVQQGTVEVTDKLNYVDVSLLLKLPLPMSQSITPNLQGGFSSNVSFGGERTFDGPGGTVTQAIEPRNSTQWALHLGTGIDVGLYAPVTLALDARYVYGLSSAPYSIGNVDGASFRNQGLMVNVALAFSVL